MGWITRKAAEHVCPRPELPPPHRNGRGAGGLADVRAGDVWQCDTCLTKWRVKHNSDQRDGDYLTFEQLDPGQPITATVVIPEGWTAEQVAVAVTEAAQRARRTGP